MIIYNVTTKVERSIATAWLDWLNSEHIPEVTGTGCFTHAVVLHLVEADDDEGITYAVQYYAKNVEHYEKYIDNFSEQIRKNAADKWRNKFISFRTVMKVVN